MFDVRPTLWLIPALPLLAAIVTALFGPGLLRRHSHWPCILGVATSFVLSVVVLVAVRSMPGPEEAREAAAGNDSATREARNASSPPADLPARRPEGKATATLESGSANYFTRGIADYFTWFRAGDVDVGFTLRADGLSAIMLVTVTFISTLIAVYSVGYMRGDPGYARFFAEIALFVFSMTGLVLADNFLLLYAFWEGVGLCSYLLIGFWFTRPSAAAAARKAFLVTRVGDLGFILGIILLWVSFGYYLDYDHVFANAQGHPQVLTVACLLLFCGAVGKSAQFPLYVWLPDAMEGPSPVSALIHAATMVTAGVYMVARCMPLFRQVPEVLLVVAGVGGFTALFASLIALTQNDLKRVLAYSTISQLGYMFLALGSGTAAALAPVAVIAAVFHLFTHAFFKALLFLAAGSVMHAMGDVIDMRRLGGLRRVLPTTHLTFLCGALALAAFPLTSGFWSKDEILGVTWLAAGAEHPRHVVYAVLFYSALLTAGLTAFYTFRAYFLTFWGEERIPHEAHGHAHEAPLVMTVPLMILAVGAVGAGIVVEPFTHWFSGFLDRHWVGLWSYGTTEAPPVTHEAGPNVLLMLAGTAVSLAGIGAAWWVYVRQPGLAGRLAGSVRDLYQLSLNKFHVDELYYFLIVQPLLGVARFCRIFDLYVVDSLVDLGGHVPRFVGVLFRPLQNGLVQFYALAMVLGLIVFLIALVRATAG
jgi:NADH-quinone oxidoreductase subunit L